MNEHFYVTLDHAAAELGVTAITLFARAVRGTFWVGVLGTTWVTTREEVERIRSERVESPAPASPVPGPMAASDPTVAERRP